MFISPTIPQPEISALPRPNTEIAAKNRSISAAVKLLNDTGAAGSSHEFSIAIDPATRLVVVRIVDLATNEVIEQLPSEYLLQVAKNLSDELAK